MILVEGFDRFGFNPLLEGHLNVFRARNVADEIGDHVDGGKIVPFRTHKLKGRDGN
jgi:hypothetical protein